MTTAVATNPQHYTANFTTDSTPNISNNVSMECVYYKTSLVFNNIQLVRVILCIIFFLISTCGNIFVLYCLCSRTRRSHVHIITLHLTLAGLSLTFFAIPMDAIWSATMMWYGGEFMCKLCQMLKQFGMYSNASMIAVVALDRMFSILFPLSNISQQRLRTTVLLGTAWSLSVFSAVPAGVIFSIVEKTFCPELPPFRQCVDFGILKRENLRPYNFFTMLMSFIIPFILTIVSYSLILVEISNIQRRDRKMMGRRASKNVSSISRARRKTFILTSLVNLTFVLLWGPYYASGIYCWFKNEPICLPFEISTWLHLLIYFHPCIHPIIIGLFMKDVRKKFRLILCKITARFRCNKLSKYPARRQSNPTESTNRVTSKLVARKSGIHSEINQRNNNSSRLIVRRNSTPELSCKGVALTILTNLDTATPDINYNRHLLKQSTINHAINHVLNDVTNHVSGMEEGKLLS